MFHVKLAALAAFLILLASAAEARECQQWQCTQIGNQKNCICVYYGPVEDRVPFPLLLDAYSPYRNPYLTPYYPPPPQ